MPNPPLFVKLISTALCSILAIILFIFNKESKARKLCMIAMLFCTVGDLFMTNTFKIDSMVTTIIGAAAFIVGHLFYANMFYLLSKKEGVKKFNLGFYAGIVVGILPLLIMEIVAIFTVENPPVLYLIAVPFYVLVITVHICANFTYSWKLKNWRGLVLAFAVTLFYVTDIWIFIGMFNLLPAKAAKDLEHCIWYFYPVAQALLILLAVPLKKKEN